MEQKKHLSIIRHNAACRWESLAAIMFDRAAGDMIGVWRSPMSRIEGTAG